MDWLGIKKRAVEYVKEYKYILIVLAAGIILMLIPSGAESKTEEVHYTQTEENQNDLQDSLSSILSAIKGAGKVQVLLTQSAGERIVYQTDTQEQQDRLEEDTVIITGSGKEQEGLIRQIIPPKYQGAIILCQGADNAAIKLAIVEAVSDATGLSTDKITVLKMK